MACNQKPAFPVKHFRDPSRDGTAVNMHVEDVEEDADACLAIADVLHRDNRAIRRRDNQVAGRCGSLRIAEEVQTETGKYNKGQGKRCGAG